MSKKLLFVEDSALVLKVMRRLVDETPEIDADFAESLAQAVSLIGDDPRKYFAAVVDLNLPDAPRGEVVDLTLKAKIPTLVLTATYSDETRTALFKKGIVDYIIKENRYSYGYAMKLILRMKRNNSIKVMVVDDSVVARKSTANLLKKYQFQVVEADGAKAAIRLLIDQPDVKLVITDYNMPEIDGFELVKLLRGKYDKQNLTIIGLSGEGNASVSAQFIKKGANDFLRKPFNQEEFFCRVMHNVESLEAIEAIKDAANRDYLTNLYNRQYFYRQAKLRIELCKKNQLDYAFAIIEIDDFKEFNNVYSEYGDEVLMTFASQLQLRFSKFITARLNGSQLVVLLWDMDLEACQLQMNEFRQQIKLVGVPETAERAFFTVSVGLCHTKEFSLRKALEKCDELMLRAQEAGKDLVLYD